MRLSASSSLTVGIFRWCRKGRGRRVCPICAGPKPVCVGGRKMLIARDSYAAMFLLSLQAMGNSVKLQIEQLRQIR
eukprot:67874-Pyramimonas_sp.AAC.1